MDRSSLLLHKVPRTHFAARYLLLTSTLTFWALLYTPTNSLRVAYSLVEHWPRLAFSETELWLRPAQRFSFVMNYGEYNLRDEGPSFMCVYSIT